MDFSRFHHDLDFWYRDSLVSEPRFTGIIDVRTKCLIDLEDQYDDDNILPSEVYKAFLEGLHRLIHYCALLFLLASENLLVSLFLSNLRLHLGRNMMLRNTSDPKVNYSTGIIHEQLNKHVKTKKRKQYHS